MKQDLQLKYGCNPHQAFASLTPPFQSALQVLNGTPSFINILDALNGWQLVRELRLATGLPAATSFKHVSPAGAAIAGAISRQELEAFDVAEPPASLIANAYLRAREADPKSSFGDFVAVSDRVDVPLAILLKSVVSDGIIAPAFDDETLPKYTQSNSIVCVLNGQTVGVGAGQQSRIDCTRIACQKLDIWRLRQHPSIRALPFKRGVKRQDRINWRIRLLEGIIDAADRAELQTMLDGVPAPLNDAEKHLWLQGFAPVSLASDGYLPFPDNVCEAQRHGIGFIAHPGGSTRDNLVAATCRDSGIALVSTGVRVFHH